MGQVSESEGVRRLGPYSRRTLAIGAGLGALVAGAAYVGVAVHGKDTVAAGTQVAGRDIGGMTKSQAASVLRGIPHPDASRAVTITAGGQQVSLKPGTAYHVDADKTLSGHLGFSLNPVSVWRHIFGSGAAEPTFVVDRQQLQDRVKQAAESGIVGAPKQGRVMFVGGKVVEREGAPGRGFDVPAMTDAIASGWPARTSYSTKLIAVQPDATSQALHTFAQGDARVAMSEPLVLRAGKASMTLQPDEVSDVISTKVINGTPQIAVDGKALEKAVLAKSSDFIEAPQDSKVVWKDGQPSTTKAVDGKKIDVGQLQQAVAAALVSNHEANLKVVADPARVRASDIDVTKLPTKTMAEFTSPFPLGLSQQSRIHNITTAIHRLDGTVVQPGQQFSLLRTLGYQLTKKRGYVAAGTLQNGLHVDGMGGGVSQVSTTVYNTSFLAGVQLDAHTPHAVWIPRYPMGREATLWNPSIDNTWTNDTGHPILIRAEVKDAAVHMRFLGTKKYDVDTRTSEKYKIVPPRLRVVRNVAGCEDTLGVGTSGFQVDVWRKLSAAGKTVRTEKIHTAYAADDIIRCQ